MGTFKTKAQKRAEKYLQIGNQIISDFENDNAIFPNFDGMMRKAYEPLLSVFALLTASFCADPEGALEMIPTFQKQVLTHPISKEDYDAMTHRIGDYYNQYRAVAIEIQTINNDWFEPSINKMAEQTENFLNISHNEEAEKAIVKYLKKYISIAKSEIR